MMTNLIRFPLSGHKLNIATDYINTTFSANKADLSAKLDNHKQIVISSSNGTVSKRTQGEDVTLCSNLGTQRQ
ncbi:conserved hypothetical protein [Vibrio crassostreae]|uniref:hypothetical protein n=2 Tax=Vibrio crassostreae TaxID=246167 RepID=UPI001B30F2F0|nr:hypothetical protein [Vibrio crassostreae]CAK2016729.1 conserved hypothetical protein [Vibrio crassostreae]CAK2021440.1 conserved hypothetical protein [Vibrio crassostreae]CAK2023094.1 conserved hypothetical protein [Vibrio crassostreae]CAK2023178.1 conserved hypothetical protein [Vibrio crassostreae]CAK2023687.1 conserved hypothetical protein [Vibrio crassostreae]